MRLTLSPAEIAAQNCKTLNLLLALALSNFAFAAPRCETCPRDQYGHILRHSGAKAAFKRQHPCPTTGKRSGACKGYVIDHIIALKRGGADNPGNMQWQELATSKAKDKQEWRQCRELRRATNGNSQL